MPQVELNLKCCLRIFKDRLPFQTTNQQVSNHTRLINATTTTLHPFNGFFSRTTWVSRYQKGKNQSGFKRGEMMGFSNTVASSGPHANNLQLAPENNHNNTKSLNFYRPDALPGTQTTVSKH